MEIGGPLTAEATRVLRELRDVGVHLDRAAHGGPDFVIRSAGREQAVVVEVKKSLNASSARQLAHLAGDVPGPTIVIAGQATAQARELLRQQGIGLIDGGGYAHVELPGLLVHVADRGARAGGGDGASRPTRLAGKAGVAAQAMLLDPDRAWQVQDLAVAAGVSPALAHRVLARLDAEQLTEVTGAGPHRTRRVTDPSALLDLWAEEMIDRHVRRHGLYRLARTPGELLEAVSEGLRNEGTAHAVTGAAAAARLAPFITAVPVTEVWIAATADPEALAGVLDAEAVSTGHNLLLLQAEDDTPLAFHQDVDGLSLVNPFRLYYDLRRDPRRGREQAERLREEILRL